MTPEAEHDVVVVGGGTAGALAAVAAGRIGARTLLVERHGAVGGVLGCGMALLGVCDSTGERVLGGLGEELLGRLRAVGGATEVIRDPHCGAFVGQDPELLKLELLGMALEAGVELLFHATVVDVAVRAGEIRSVLLATKAGLTVIPGRTFVDCTGDADLVAAAGGEWTYGRGGRMAQPASRIFRVGGVVLDKLWEHLRAHPEDCDAPPGWATPTFAVDNLATAPGASMDVFGDLIERARVAGEYDVPRNRIGIDTFPGRSEVTVNATRVHGVDGTDPTSVSAAEVTAQLQMLAIIRFLRRRAPGFADSYLVSAPHQLGVRESRRIVGDDFLSEDDVIAGRQSEDAVGLGAYPIDVHAVAPDEGAPEEHAGGGVSLRPVVHAYAIPVGCLVPRGTENLVVAGRCISASHAAAASARGQAVCMVTGHAAGVLGALAARTTSGNIRAVETAAAQECLRRQGAILTRAEPTRTGGIENAA